MNPIATELVRRLRKGDDGAWFELYRIFGPALTRAIGRFGRRRFSAETVRDLTQETLCEASKSIDRFDPGRGVRFSTWLLSIARYVVYGEFDRRMAKKRNEGERPVSLMADEQVRAEGAAPGSEYQRAIFRAKVYAALEAVSQRRPFLEFEAYRMRLTDSITSRAIAEALGVSEPSISRYLRRVRDDLREEIRQVVWGYSFTDEELAEMDHAGLSRADDKLFDEALSDLYLEEQTLRMSGEGRA